MNLHILILACLMDTYICYAEFLRQGFFHSLKCNLSFRLTLNKGDIVNLICPIQQLGKAYRNVININIV
jgi:hypothetical protein